MKFSIFPNSQILILFFLLRPLARHLMPLFVASMSCASIRNQNVPYRTTRRRQNIHYSLFIEFCSSSSSITSGFNPDTLLSSFSGEYNSPLSSSRAQDFSFEVGFLGFLGYSGQDIGIFEDYRLYQKSQ